MHHGCQNNKKIVIDPVIEIVMVPFGKVNKYNPCFWMLLLFWTSAFHYNLENIAFTTAENCPTNRDFMHMYSKFLYHFEKKDTWKLKEVIRHTRYNQMAQRVQLYMYC